MTLKLKFNYHMTLKFNLIKNINYKITSLLRHIKYNLLLQTLDHVIIQ